MGRSGPAHSPLAVCTDAACRLVISTRRAFIYVISHLVSWLVLARSPAAFRRQQQLDLADSTAIIQRLQAYRTPARDAFMLSYSRFAVWVLYAFPCLFWLYDAQFARLGAYVVLFGVVACNVLKDVFRLPRPPSPPVWTPLGAMVDDTASLRDFAFPSTHAMNAVTIPAMVLWHLVSARFVAPTSPWFMLAVLLASFHFVSLCTSRLYLGCVFVGDIKAGIVMGALVLCVAVSGLSKFDHWLLYNPEALPIYALATLLILGVCPQPRPATPTFSQTVKLMGLAFGNAAGGTFLARGVAVAWAPPASLGAGAGRLAVGVTVVAVCAAMASAVVSPLCRWVMAVPARMRPTVVTPASVRAPVAEQGGKPNKSAWASWEEPLERADPDDSPSATRANMATALTGLLSSAVAGFAITGVVPVVCHAVQL